MERINVSQAEQMNDGQKIHLFFNPDLAVWMAQGKSAYVFRVFLKSLGYDNLRVYSTRLKTPITITGVDTIVKLKALKPFNKEEENHIEIIPDNEFDQQDYLQWTERLKNEAKSPLGFNIVTHVSEYVPKDKYIEDNMSSFSRNTKRIGDMLAAAGAMVVFSPLFLACYTAIKMEDKGPAIFKQERIGRFGKPFNIYKFRSMSVNAEQNGPQLSHCGGDHDRRLTKVGKFIRSHHLDELPQLWNVFIGDMSFIGPRPERKFFIDQIMEYDKRYQYLYQIRPGVTSYATLYNGYTDTIEKMLRRLEYDLYYLGHRSWWFDFKILVKTFLSIVFGKKF